MRWIRTRTGLILGVAAVCSMAVFSQASGATSKTETRRYYVRDVSVKLMKADGSVVTHPPIPAPGAGDVLQINSRDYKGNHARHEKQWTASQTERCSFVAAGPPDCQISVAIAGSLLVFDGNPSTLVNGTGRYQGASGRVLSATHVAGGADVVARIHLH